MFPVCTDIQFCFNFLDKTLKRGISHATDNVNIVSQARSELIYIDSTEGTEDELHIVETPVYTFILPDLLQLEGIVWTALYI